VGAKDGALGEGAIEIGVGHAARALRDRPLRHRELLRLHGAQPAHDLVGAVERPARQALIAQAKGGDLLVRHRRTLSPARLNSITAP
jgi:hypothetical protein